eukprot:GHVS01038221.1.p1 GENE.GHVS01038221.1~~GHVS01038221.1.p1  ORF type:complete len:805 (-),score=178.16 GHVS01038221.1:567-2981(-)
MTQKTLLTPIGHYRRRAPTFEGSFSELMYKLVNDVCCGEACRRRGRAHSSISGSIRTASTTSQVFQRVGGANEPSDEEEDWNASGPLLRVQQQRQREGGVGEARENEPWNGINEREFQVATQLPPSSSSQQEQGGGGGEGSRKGSGGGAAAPQNKGGRLDSAGPRGSAPPAQTAVGKQHHERSSADRRKAEASKTDGYVVASATAADAPPTNVATDGGGGGPEGSEEREKKKVSAHGRGVVVGGGQKAEEGSEEEVVVKKSKEEGAAEWETQVMPAAVAELMTPAAAVGVEPVAAEGGVEKEAAAVGGKSAAAEGMKQAKAVGMKPVEGGGVEDEAAAVGGRPASAEGMKQAALEGLKPAAAAGIKAEVAKGVKPAAVEGVELAAALEEVKPAALEEGVKPPAEAAEGVKRAAASAALGEVKPGAAAEIVKPAAGSSALVDAEDQSKTGEGDGMEAAHLSGKAGAGLRAVGGDPGVGVLGSADAGQLKRTRQENVEFRPEVQDVAMLGDMDGGMGAYVHVNGEGGAKRALLSVSEDTELAESVNVLRVERGSAMAEIPCESIERIISDEKEIQQYIDRGKLEQPELAWGNLANAFVMKLKDQDELVCVEAGSAVQKDMMLQSIRDAETAAAAQPSPRPSEPAERAARLSQVLEQHDGTYNEYKFANRWNDVGIKVSEYADTKQCKLFLDTDVSRILLKRHGDLRSLPLRLVSATYTTQEELEDLAEKGLISEVGDASCSVAMSAAGFRKPFVVQFSSNQVKADVLAAIEKLSVKIDETAGGKDNRLNAVKNNRRASAALVAAFG